MTAIIATPDLTTPGSPTLPDQPAAADDSLPPLDGTLSDTLTYLPASHLNYNIEPKSVDHVFQKDIKLGKTEFQNQEVIARNSVRRNVYPIIKFLWFPDKDVKIKTFDHLTVEILKSHPKEFRKHHPCAYEFLKGINKVGPDTPIIDKAIYWNTNRKLLENALSTLRSNDISLIKKNIVQGTIFLYFVSRIVNKG